MTTSTILLFLRRIQITLFLLVILISNSYAQPTNDCIFNAIDVTSQINSIDSVTPFSCATYLFNSTGNSPTKDNINGNNVTCSFTNHYTDVWFKFTVTSSTPATWLDAFIAKGTYGATTLTEFISALYSGTPGGTCGPGGNITGLTYIGCSNYIDNGGPRDKSVCTTPYVPRINISGLAPGIYYYRVWNYYANAETIEIGLCAESSVPVGVTVDPCPSTPTVALTCGAPNININETHFNLSNAGTMGNACNTNINEPQLAVAPAGQARNNCTGGWVAYIPFLNNVMNNSAIYAFNVNAFGTCQANVVIKFDSISYGGRPGNVAQIQVMPAPCAGGSQAVMSGYADSYCFEMRPTGPLPNGTYYIVVDGQDGQLIKYDLNILITYTGIGCTPYTPPAGPTAVNGERCGPGSVDLSVTGCTGTVNWYNTVTGGNAISTGSTFTTPSILDTTIYYAACVVGGCPSLRTPVTAFINPSPIVTATTMPAACGSATGSITATSSGGNSPYSYSIDGTNFQTSDVFNNLNTGNYTVTGMDDNGCTGNTDVTVGNNSGFAASIIDQTNQNCFGESIGSITLASNGGIPPYTYSIDGTNFNTDSTFSGLSAGNYTITIMDGSGCTFTQSVNITQPPKLKGTVGVSDATCDVDNGEINLSGTYGTPSYTYSKDNGTSFQSIGNFKNLAAGNYALRIKDSNGCIRDTNVTINNIPSDLSSSIISQDSVSCYNGTDGRVTVKAVQGTPPYTYAIDSTSFQQSGTFTGLQAMSYIITIKDNSGCEVTQAVTIEQPEEFIADATSTSITCNGDCNGTAIASVAGGTGPYTYSWSNGIDTEKIIDLCAGSYEVAVEDANKCSANASVTLNEPAPITAAFSSDPEKTTLSAAAICFTDKSTGAIKWSWNFKDPKDIAGSNEANPCHTYSDTGVYCVELVAEDANGCTGQVSDCVEITPDQEEFPFKFFIPNSFTPDNDGINDDFSGDGENFSDYEMYVFNRWGSLIFYTDDINTKWEGKRDGAEKGELLPDGVYIYLVNVKALNGKKHQFIGNVTLLRKD